MGGIDLLDRIISYYRIAAKTRKWTVKVILRFIDFAISASWNEYRRFKAYQRDPAKDLLYYLDFREYIGWGLMYKRDLSSINNSSSESNDDEELPTKRRRRIPVPHPPKELRQMSALHLPEIPQQDNFTKCRMQNCKKKARVCCTACKLFLCFNKDRNCFMKYHFECVTFWLYVVLLSLL